MLHHPIAIVCVLLVIEGSVLFLSSHRRTKSFFKFLPSVFWIYFLPMVASTAGLLDSKSPVYSLITQNILPASLFLLLICVDIKAISRLGKTALMMFFAGSLGIIVGTPLVFFIFKPWVGGKFWSGFGALSASWTGGSANMIAVKEALGTPDAVFLPMVMVDTIVPYCWMGLLIAAASRQKIYDRWNRSDRRLVDELTRRPATPGTVKADADSLQWEKVIFILLLAGLGSFASISLARLLPQIKDMISTYAWTIIVVSFLGILLSLTPLNKIKKDGADTIGYLLLYFVLTSIGAKANLAQFGSTAVLIVAGFLIILFHALVLLAVGRVMKAPLSLAAAASQANIGGVASAPLVAEVYQPGLASVGLLMAILGNIVGTYIGILTGQLCRFVTGG